jgi:hypothetical protein
MSNMQNENRLPITTTSPVKVIQLRNRGDR